MAFIVDIKEDGAPATPTADFYINLLDGIELTSSMTMVGDVQEDRIIPAYTVSGFGNIPIKGSVAGLTIDLDP